MIILIIEAKAGDFEKYVFNNILEPLKLDEDSVILENMRFQASYSLSNIPTLSNLPTFSLVDRGKTVITDSNIFDYNKLVQAYLKGAMRNDHQNECLK
ncbi:gp55 [Listeria phage P40]|uniref:gp55 n=1 Tax=Listeria phage P40 TaxID=560178 RepID=UPI0001819904|nr:gp55 [Listeria phage P40]ACI00415.1 gp55 [Listeria phage P40]